MLTMCMLKPILIKLNIVIREKKKYIDNDNMTSEILNNIGKVHCIDIFFNVNFFLYNQNKPIKLAKDVFKHFYED